MTGHLILADGTKWTGTLHGASGTAAGWLAANTAVVGFQEMATDAAYKGQILAFTYPEIGSVGVAGRFCESSGVQIAGMVVKVLSEYRSHYLAEDSLENFLAGAGAACLSGIDTRGLAVHLRENGEMSAAIAPDDADLGKLGKTLSAMKRPHFRPTEPPVAAAGTGGVKLAVLDLGIRRSQWQQIARCCRPAVFAHDAEAEEVLACKPAGIFVSDGPGAVLPPDRTVATLRKLLGKAPILACGLGHVALGMALGCEAEFLKRGHHGANYAVRNVTDGRAEVTQQRHSAALQRDSVLASSTAELLWENMTDQTVEGIRAADSSAVGLQAILAAPQPGAVNAHLLEFIEHLPGGRSRR